MNAIEVAPAEPLDIADETGESRDGGNRRCNFIGWFLRCRRPAVIAALWNNGNYSHLCARHADLLAADTHDWTDEGEGGQPVAPLMTESPDRGSTWH